MRSVRSRKVFLWLGLALALIVGAPIGMFVASDNFGVIQPGTIYRSAQMSDKALTQVINTYAIKTVLNLRGPNPRQAWYRAERSATLRAGATQLDLSLATDQSLTRNQAQTILEVLETCDKPVLIHCQFGAERTGLVAAFAELAREGSSLADARSQFSLKYKFLPIKDGLVMLRHLDQYENDLKSRHMTHSSRRFHQYIADEYQPAGPSRADWPFDPYPLLVIHRPDSWKTVGQSKDLPIRK